MTVETAPKVLVLGALGFVGRNFVQYLVENKLASSIRGIDKALPQTAYLSPAVKAAFDHPSVEIMQANLINPVSIEKCYTRSDGTEFDYVFNFAAETKYSQVSEVYRERIYNLSVNCAKEAAKRHVKVFLEMSTSEVYDSNKEPSTEGSPLKPWTLIAKQKVEVCKTLQNMEGLNLVIVRPAVVYGVGATSGITTRLVIGRVYKKLNEEMKLLWNKDLKLNTVHIRDVVRACWHLAKWYDENGIATKKDRKILFNLADKQDTDQETINQHLETIFGIKTGYHGSIISSFAKLNLGTVTEDVNEKHLGPWADLLKESNIAISPLSPYVDEELLHSHPVSVNGTLIERETGFTYEVPYLTKEKLEEIINGYKELKVWPTAN
ncbi:hypothetical protein INT44_004389 [Umbelopsis vinacea]|uniref:NAD-dependent epimerase/dehydratase domain-containing protein n=1 Tax=Umbelopsis vinacea TaxID=44442 RepID=A0A8H7UPF8_9FUNG|nr:hypothetical protein INT44_004389 [Umbelopsis vinacea]KAI9284268.1 hypothetical protein BC943DRAFT_66058 [Umbelopsis sp. AD052]